MSRPANPWAPLDHVPEHFFKGVCICPCRRCTATVGGVTICLCSDCPPAICGLKASGKLAEMGITGGLPAK